MEKKRLCINCKHFESYRQMYDDDPEEPDDLGRCLINKRDGCTDKSFCEAYNNDN